MASDILPSKCSQNNISFHQIKSSNKSKLVNLASQVMMRRWDETFSDWKYFQNPTGQVYGNYAELDGHAVGSYGNIPVKVKLGDELLTFAQAVDAMIDPQYRRQGLFTDLAKMTYTRMDRDGIALTYAFPNPVSEADYR